jgi:GNAT superfamily N-acetyltransferase
MPNTSSPPHIREYLSFDVARVWELNTSFTTREKYEVHRTDAGLLLTRKLLAQTISKTFSLDLVADSWEAAFVCVVDGRLCGFVAGELQEWNRRLVIRHFYVDSAARGKGLGRLLIQRMLQWGRERKASAAWAETSNLNVPGVQAYDRLGFFICGFDESLYFGTENSGEFALFLSCTLDPAGVS